MCFAPFSGRGGRARGMRALNSKCSLCVLYVSVCTLYSGQCHGCQWGVNVITDPHTLSKG